MGPFEPFSTRLGKGGTQLGQQGPDETSALVDDGSLPD